MKVISVFLPSPQPLPQAFKQTPASTPRFGLNQEYMTPSSDSSLADIAKLNPDSVKTLVVYNTRVTDTGISHLKKLVNLRELELKETNVTEAGVMDALPHLKNLHTLTLNQPKYTDKLVMRLRDITNIRSLDLSARLTAEGVKALKSMSHIERLSLDGSRITDSGLSEAKKLKNLHSLTLTGQRINDARLADLAPALGNLHSLYLNQTNVTSIGLAQLKLMPKLELLSLAGSRQINNTAWRYILGLPNLSLLDIEGTQIDTCGTKHLRYLQNLRYFYFSDNQFTPLTVENIKRSLKLTAGGK